MNISMLSKENVEIAQQLVVRYHYLHQRVHQLGSVEGYMLDEWAGLVLFARPQAQRCLPWYGSVEDVQAGRAEVTRWQVLNLARVWLHPNVQAGGMFCLSGVVPGFYDRRGVWRSTLASEMINKVLSRIGYTYLLRRPPVFMEQPYQIEYVLSYCDTSKHKGSLYVASGFELYRTNERGIQTWRKRLQPLTVDQRAMVWAASAISKRAQKLRAERGVTQLSLGGVL